MARELEVLYFVDDTGDTMVKRVPEDGSGEIKWGAQLVVAESQNAVFFRDGKSLDVFGPGRYTLQTQNVGSITKWVMSFAFGPNNPFRADVFFLNMKLFPNLKWGTKEPILFKDTQFQMIRLRAFGVFSIQIIDPTLFINKVVGTQGLFTTADIQDYLRNIMLSRLTDILGKKFKSVLELPKDFSQLSISIKSNLDLEFEALGLYLHDFYLTSVSVPPQVQEMIDTRAGMAAIGDMDQFLKYKAAIAMEKAAANPNSAASAGVGVGAGLGMGFMIPQMIQNTMQQPVAGSPAKTSETALDKIKKLKDLYDLGAITEDEFKEKKNELMKGI